MCDFRLKFDHVSVGYGDMVQDIGRGTLTNDQNLSARLLPSPDCFPEAFPNFEADTLQPA
jgi:hypothetical protein